MKLVDFYENYTGSIEEIARVITSTPLIFWKNEGETDDDAEKRFNQDIAKDEQEPGYLYQMGYYNDDDEDEESDDDSIIRVRYENINGINIAKDFDTIKEAVQYVHSLDKRQVKKLFRLKNDTDIKVNFDSAKFRRQIIKKMFADWYPKHYAPAVDDNELAKAMQNEDIINNFILDMVDSGYNAFDDINMFEIIRSIGEENDKE